MGADKRGEVRAIFPAEYLRASDAQSYLAEKLSCDDAPAGIVIATYTDNPDGDGYILNVQRFGNLRDAELALLGAHMTKWAAL